MNCISIMMLLKKKNRASVSGADSLARCVLSTRVQRHTLPTTPCAVGIAAASLTDGKLRLRQGACPSSQGLLGVVRTHTQCVWL